MNDSREPSELLNSVDEWIEHAQDHLAKAHALIGVQVIDGVDLADALRELCCLAAVLTHARTDLDNPLLAGLQRVANSMEEAQ